MVTKRADQVGDIDATMEEHWAILYTHKSPLLDEEARFYWFLSESEARREFIRVKDKGVTYLIKKTGGRLEIVEINGPEFHYEGRSNGDKTS